MDFIKSFFTPQTTEEATPEFSFPSLDQALAELKADAHSFLQHHNLSDPLFSALAFLHVFLLILIIFTRRQISTQFFIFFVCLALARSGEILNELGSSNWQALGASRNYFDPNGAFLSLVLLAPLLLLAGLILFNFFVHLTSFAATVKAAQIKQQRRKQKQT